MAIFYKSSEVTINFIAKCFVDDPSFSLHGDFAERIPDPIGAATSNFVAASFRKRLVGVSTEDVAAAVHIAAAIDTTSLSSDHG